RAPEPAPPRARPPRRRPRAAPSWSLRRLARRTGAAATPAPPASPVPRPPARPRGRPAPRRRRSRATRRAPGPSRTTPCGRAANAERDRDRIVRLVADGNGDALHAELVRPAGGTACQADGRLARGQPLDLDLAPADAAHPEPEDLGHRLLGRPAAGEGLGSIA